MVIDLHSMERESLLGVGIHLLDIRVYLGSTYFAEIENFLLKVL